MAGADSAFRATRILAGAVEAFAGQVYFAPEAHAGYQQLGFSGSPGLAGGVAMPDMHAYFCSRGAILGQVAGEVVASAFAVFNPAIVIPAVDHGWSLTSAAAIIAVRDEAAVGQLRRILGDNPDGALELAELLEPVSGSLEVAGRPLYAGLMAAEVPTTRSARRGGSPTAFESSEATRTLLPGLRLGTAPSRSDWSPSCIGGCGPSHMSGPEAGRTPNSTQVSPTWKAAV
jgi:hypothetical protein